MKTAISFVIPAYNSKQDLENLLPQLCEIFIPQRGDEIIVVDDNSTDNTNEYIKTNFKTVTLLETPSNSGFASTANLGVHSAKNDIIFLLNPDTEIHNEFRFEKYIALFEEDPTIFSITPTIVRETPNGPMNEAVPEVELTNTGFNLNVLTPIEKYDQKIEIIYPCGGASFIHKKKFEEINGFDTIFNPFYFEDFDLGLRAWRKGWRCIYVPNGIIYHKHHGSIGKFNRRIVKFIAKRNYYICLWKNFPKKICLSSFLFDLISGLVTLDKYKVVGIVSALTKINSILKRRKSSDNPSGKLTPL